MIKNRLDYIACRKTISALGILIKLDHIRPTDIGYLKGTDVVAGSLEIRGEGALFACLLSFYNKGDHPASYRELYFHHTVHTLSKDLPPGKEGFRVSDYDYCSFSILTGSVKEGDEIFLSCYRL